MVSTGQVNSYKRFANIYLNENRLDQPDLILDIILRPTPEPPAPATPPPPPAEVAQAAPVVPSVAVPVPAPPVEPMP